MQYWLVMPAAGSGRRFGGAVPKQYLPLAGRSVIEHALEPFLADPRCLGVVVALDAGDRTFETLPPARNARLRRVPGGARRCDSVRNALDAIDDDDAAWVLVHDAARPCVTRNEIEALLAGCAHDAAGGLLAVPVADTLKHADEAQRVQETPRRDGFVARTDAADVPPRVAAPALRAAQASGREPTDEAQAVEWLGESPRLIAGNAGNLKITTAADLTLAAAVLGGVKGSMELRTGSGFDVHAFGPGDAVMLGGVRIAWQQGVVAHSDGDVLLHALTDALLGAAGLGDIGQHFPDSDPQWRGAASTQFVQHAVRLLAGRGWRLVECRPHAARRGAAGGCAPRCDSRQHRRGIGCWRRAREPEGPRPPSSWDSSVVLKGSPRRRWC